MLPGGILRRGGLTEEETGSSILHLDYDGDDLLGWVSACYLAPFVLGTTHTVLSGISISPVWDPHALVANKKFP